MNKDMGKIAAIAVLGVMMLATIGMFFAFGFFLRPVQWVSLLFLLLAEVLFFGGWLFSSQKKQATNISIYQVGLQLSYFVVTLVLFFLTLFINSIFAAIFLHLVVFGVFRAGIFVAMAVAQRVADGDAKVMQARSVMDECEKRVHSLLLTEQVKSYERELNEIYEIFRYADKISRNSEMDAKILENVMELQEFFGADAVIDEAQVKKVLRALKVALEQRKIELSQSKRGGF